MSGTDVGDRTDGFALVVTGFVTDLVASNRKLLDRLDWELQRLRHE